MKQLMLAAAMIATLGPPAATAGEKEVYRIGIAKSAVRDVAKNLLTPAGESFQELMKNQTGLNGTVTLDHEWLRIARDLNDGSLELGVLQGHEFAWARQKYPDLQPLMCTVARPQPVTAYLLVRHDSKAVSLADLKDGKLVTAATLKDHARLFLVKRQAAEMGGAAFRSTATADTVHDAIQKVIDGEADLTVTDHSAWNYFQKLYPGASQNLKVMAESEEFPPTVLVYKKGGVDEIALKKLRDGLLTAHQTAKSARLMGSVKIEKFVALPDGFEARAAACLKAYPPSARRKVSLAFCLTYKCGLSRHKLMSRNSVRHAVRGDHYHSVANPAKGEPAGERGAEPPKATGYRPNRKSAKRRPGKKGDKADPRP